MKKFKKRKMWPKDWSCDILVKKVTAFCPCPKSLPEAKVKSFGLIPLTEEISKQPSIDCCVDISDNSNGDL